MNLLHSFRMAKSKGEFCRKECVSFTRLRHLHGTVESLRRRVADRLNVPMDFLEVEEPPFEAPHAKITILRVLQTWLFHDTMIELSKKKALQAGDDGTFTIELSGPSVEPKHLLQVLDADRHPFQILNRVKTIHSGSFVAGDAYPYPLPGSYGVYRAPRIEALLDETPSHSLASFNAMQMDVTSEFARRIHADLISATPETDLGLEALSIMERWTGDLSVDGPEGLIFSAWVKALSHAIYADELGGEFERFFFPRRLFLENVLTGDASSWCDNVETESRESCAVTAGLALDTAMNELAVLYGPDPSLWNWGELHQASFDHPLTGVPLVGDWFTVRTPVGGDGSTLNVAHFSYRSDDYSVYHGPSLRAVYDLSDLDASRFIHAPGQSGHPWSRHYSDLAERWAAGDSYEIRTDWTPDTAPDGSRTLILEGSRNR